jgi:hypothetical protein
VTGDNRGRYGVNRPEGGRTAPTAINTSEIDVFAALPTGAG